MGTDLFLVAVFALQRLHHIGDGKAGHFAAEVAHLLAAFALPDRQVLDRFLQLLLDRLDVFLNAGALILGQAVELFRRHDLVVVGRRDGEPDRGAQQGQPPFLGIVLNVLETAFLEVLVFFLDRMQTCTVLVAFEQCRNCRTQILDKLAHVAAERAGLTGRKLQRFRLVRRLEIIDIGPVRRRGDLCRFMFQHPRDQRVTAGSRRPQHEDVVAVMAHAHTKA